MGMSRPATTPTKKERKKDPTISYEIGWRHDSTRSSSSLKSPPEWESSGKDHILTLICRYGLTNSTKTHKLAKKELER